MDGMQILPPAAHISQPAPLDEGRTATIARPESIRQLATWFQETYHHLNIQQMEEQGAWDCELEGLAGA